MGETMRRTGQEKSRDEQREPLLLFDPNEHGTTKKTRYELYSLLRQRPMTCDQLVSAAHVTKRTVELHLRELRARGIISGERMEGDNRMKVWKAHDAIVNDDAFVEIEHPMPMPEPAQGVPDDGGASDETEPGFSPHAVPFIDALAFEEPDARNRIAAAMRARSITVETIARETGIPFGTAYRHVLMMKKTGMAIRLGDGHTLTALGSRAIAFRGHAQAAPPAARNGPSNAAAVEPRRVIEPKPDAPTRNDGGTDGVSERTAEEWEEIRRWAAGCKTRPYRSENVRTTIDPLRASNEELDERVFGGERAEGAAQTLLASVLGETSLRLTNEEWGEYAALGKKTTDGNMTDADAARFLALLQKAHPHVPADDARELIALAGKKKKKRTDFDRYGELVSRHFTFEHREERGEG